MLFAVKRIVPVAVISVMFLVVLLIVWTGVVVGGGGGYGAADQSNANFLYGETPSLSLFRSTDGGSTQPAINTGIADPTGCAVQAGPNHTFTSTKSTDDEITIAVVEIRGATSVADHRWVERLTSPSTSLDVTVTRPAVLVALWYGNGDIGNGAHTATPNNGFSVIDSVTADTALVQLTVATKSVTAGTYNVTWTSATGEGAQLWLIAVDDPFGGNMPTVNSHVLDYDVAGTGFGSITTPGINTDSSSGSVILVTTGRGVLNASQVFSDSEGNNWTQIGTRHAYTNWPNSGTEVWATRRFAPTAANVAISGSVLTADGQGVRSARLTLISPDGARRTAITSSFGYYRFDGIEVGQTYVLEIASERYAFAEPSRIFVLKDELTDIDFVAMPQ